MALVYRKFIENGISRFRFKEEFSIGGGVAEWAGSVHYKQIYINYSRLESLGYQSNSDSFLAIEQYQFASNC